MPCAPTARPEGRPQLPKRSHQSELGNVSDHHQLGVGGAGVDAAGRRRAAPGQRAMIVPPTRASALITDAERAISFALAGRTRYDAPIDRDSAYEMLTGVRVLPPHRLPRAALCASRRACYAPAAQGSAGVRQSATLLARAAARAASSDGQSAARNAGSKLETACCAVYWFVVEK
jgi:hypothetical protein